MSMFMETTDKRTQWINIDHIVTIETDPDDMLPGPSSLAVIWTTDGRILYTGMTLEELVKKLGQSVRAGRLGS